MTDYTPGQRVIRFGPHAASDQEIPLGTLGTVLEISAHGYIRVEFDGIKPNPLAMYNGKTGHLMAEDEIKAVES